MDLGSKAESWRVRGASPGFAASNASCDGGWCLEEFGESCDTLAETEGMFLVVSETVVTEGARSVSTGVGESEVT